MDLFIPFPIEAKWEQSMIMIEYEQHSINKMVMIISHDDTGLYLASNDTMKKSGVL